MIGSRKGGDGSGWVITMTEFEILKGYADGLNTKQIATKLHYSNRTIETYKAEILANTDCNSIPHAIATLFRQRLLK
jgi:DNA-binding NarL/FixJ family response regulator